MNGLVNVVVPVYNTEEYLDRCLSSLVNQTYRNLEILLIDDGSKDNSGTICDQYRKMDNRIHVFHTSNLGVAHARNVGIEKAKGTFITFVDSDDYVDKTMIETLMNDIATNNSDLSISSLLNGDNSQNFCACLCPENEDEILFLSQKYLIFGPTQKIYKTEIVKQIRFPNNVEYGEDLLFNLEYLKRIKYVSYINQQFYHYCRTDNGLSSKIRWDMFENDIVLHQALLEWYESIGIFHEKARAFLYGRVFDTAINSICLTFRKDCPFGFSKTKKLIESIVNNDLVKESIEYADIEKYAKWQVFLIKQGNVFTLSVIALLERIING